MTWTENFTWQAYRFSLSMTENALPQAAFHPAPLAPGAGEITFPALSVFADGQTVQLEAEVNGEQIARVFLEVLWENPQGWLVGPVARVELPAPQTRDISGVKIPVWDKSNWITADWQPTLRLLISGQQAAWAFLWPEQNPGGGTGQEYRLYAIWQPQEGQEHKVRLHFAADGTFLRMADLGGGQGRPGKSRAATPRPGDSITPELTWLHPDVETGGWQSLPGFGNTLSLGTQSLRWEEMPVMPGRYQIGILALDMDNQPHRTCLPIQIG
jgi:hypothetical protein